MTHKMIARPIPLLLFLICILCFCGCRRALSGAELYRFPESDAQISVFYAGCGETSRIVFNADTPSADQLTAWFYGLSLRPCEAPEDAEGMESYSISVNNTPVFTYQDRGSDSYLLLQNVWYQILR